MDEKEQAILGALEADIKVLKDPLKETITEIIKQGFSDFPILLAHMDEIQIADKVIDKEMFNTTFNFSATILEVLVKKGIVKEEAEESMKNKIREAKDSACILLVHPDVMRFVFYPLSKA